MGGPNLSDEEIANAIREFCKRMPAPVLGTPDDPKNLGTIDRDKTQRERCIELLMALSEAKLGDTPIPDRPDHVVTRPATGPYPDWAEP